MACHLYNNQNVIVYPQFSRHSPIPFLQRKNNFCAIKKKKVCGNKICFNLEILSLERVSLALCMLYIFITPRSDVSTSIATFQCSIFFGFCGI